MDRKPTDSVDVDTRFSKLRDKIDQALSKNEPKAAKRKSHEATPEKQAPRKKQQRQKPESNPPGQQKPQGKPQQKPQQNGAQKQSKPLQPAPEEALLDEILALGGDKDDLDLVMGAASESEDEYDDSSAPLSRDTRDELAKFASQLGFSQLAVEDAPEDAPEVETSIPDEEVAATATPTVPSAVVRPVPPGKKATILEPRADWHAASLGDLPTPVSDDVSAHRRVIDLLQKHALALLEEDSSTYAKTFLASSTHKFLSTIMASGTMNDKVSALTLAVQESPVHNVRALEALLGLASKKNRSQAIIALGAIVDLMGPGLVLPPGRRLRAFHNQPGLVGALQRDSVYTWDPALKLPRGITAQHLISWAYEDWLKGTYFKLIQLLEVWCGDEIDYSRTRSLDFVYGLIREKPEQEANLLRLLVNRVGDRDRKIASRSSHLLIQLQSMHPGMKDVIIRTIEHEVILRPGQGLRSRYYAINTLNQTILSTKESAVSANLLRIYFEVFTAMLKSGEMGLIQTPEVVPGANPKPQSRQRKPPPSVAKADSDGSLAEKVVTAVLVGINRAVPFAQDNDVILESQMDTLYRIAHSANFNTSMQAMLLIQQLVSTKSFAADRFYRVLYESLLDPRLPGSSKQAMYLNLLLRSLKSDVNTKRVKAFVKRMLQGLALHQPPFICGVLYVLSQLRKSMPGLLTLIEEPEEQKGQSEAGGAEQDAPAEIGDGRYDGRKRDPEHSNAHNTCLWEIVPNLHHYHPAVLIYASSVMGSDVVAEKPDLESHSLIRFLDKFAYRGPKTKELTRGGSIMQPLQVGKSSADTWLRSKSTLASGTSVNNASFWTKKVENVAAEDVFFHEYFSQIGRTSEPSKRRAEGEAEAGEEDEDEVWRALTAGHDDDEAAMDGLEGSMDDDSSDGDMPDWDSSSESDEADEADEEIGEDEDDEFMAVGSDSEVEEGGDGEDVDKEAVKAPKPKSRKQRLRELPMFASVDDYADLLAQEDDL
ncbi:related to MAK21 - protein required for 60S ribosomal subunit biogenesis [Cephalotrichum gorgonifer]|uniref:Related to MAK21 - protein required for 60S ribosomal subunit biogenesis n=1 Tax=Cephalotrichum gorgonifer TaxID=2041049 RepID=A0AAE8N1H3_9PEZI|nr:related to MAK21 - protein required for 60S ribosomal subunit biogenesis [Cephalotrichum gorgonifer]